MFGNATIYEWKSLVPQFRQRKKKTRMSKNESRSFFTEYTDSWQK